MVNTDNGSATRKVIVSEFLTLDGVMQAPGGPDEDRRGGFEHGGWQMSYFDEVAGDVLTEGLAATDALLLGRRTYEIFAGYWPFVGDDDPDEPIATKFNGMQKYVVSRTLNEATWQNTTLIKENVPEEVAKVKQQPGNNIQVIGSGGLVQTLMKHDLIDEYHLTINPLVLGSGFRLFPDGSPKTSLQLVDSTTTTTGAVILTYQPAGRSTNEFAQSGQGKGNIG